MNKKLADLLLSNVEHDKDYYENLYPKREEMIVTRMAPSPTGFIHIGGLFTGLITKKFASQNNGICILRIEDTDQKRLIENGIDDIIKSFKDFGINFEEGPISQEKEIGSYGPYIQSKRKDIYQAFAKYFVEKGYAYPCFCSEDELNEIRKKQENIKDRIGYYGSYASCRNLTEEEIKEKIKNKEPYVIRLKSQGNYDKKTVVNDLIKGRIEFPQNDIDIVLIKSDGFPTYHFAHLVDDYLMRVTHVIRGDEWISSLPVHMELFNTLGVEPPKYCHLSPLMKIDEEGSRRKLSKRKDPEAKASYYHEKGIPNEALKLYIMTVANSNFEIWMEQNRDTNFDDFIFDFKKVSSSGSLFDLDKLLNISKNYISHLKASILYENLVNWALEFDKEFYDLLCKYKDYSISILNIEREQEKPRKDFSSYSEIKNYIWYMYEELFNIENKNYEWQKITDKDKIKTILNKYINKYYNASDNKETWFNKIKLLCDELGYASDMKDYKNNPTKYKGNVIDVSTVIRVSLTTKYMTPDLYEIMKLLKEDIIKKRFLEI